jgi:hypothetical protein
VNDFQFKMTDYWETFYGHRRCIFMKYQTWFFSFCCAFSYIDVSIELSIG